MNCFKSPVSSLLRRGALAALCLALSIPAIARDTDAPATKTVAHRGAHTEGAPENSIAALKKAMYANYYGIELDVWMTADGRIVVHHDGRADGYVFQDETYPRIKDITLSNGEKLPTFDSFIETFKSNMDRSDSKLIVEIKTHSTPGRNNAATDMVMKMIEDAGIRDRVEYIAFSFDNCKRIVANDPEARVGYLMGDLSPQAVHDAGIVSVDYHSGAYNSNPFWIREAKALGMIVNVWTVNRQADMIDFMQRGADYITTDDPALLTELSCGSAAGKR